MEVRQDKDKIYVDGRVFNAAPIKTISIGGDEDSGGFIDLRESSEFTIDLDVRNRNINETLKKLLNVPGPCYGRQPYSIKCKKCEYVNGCIKQKINNRWNRKRV